MNLKTVLSNSSFTFLRWSMYAGAPTIFEGKLKEIADFNVFSNFNELLVDLQIRQNEIDEVIQSEERFLAFFSRFFSVPNTYRWEDIEKPIVVGNVGNGTDNLFMVRLVEELQNKASIIQFINEVLRQQLGEVKHHTGIKQEYEVVDYRLEKNFGEYIDLLGINEFAKELNWSTAKLSAKFKREQNGTSGKKPLPTPVSVLAATPVWTIEQVEQFKKEL